MSSRPRLSLDGPWQFWTDNSASLSPTTLEMEQAAIIAVPAPIQAQFDDLRFFTGAAWYRRHIEIPAEWLEDVVMLHFGAVDYFADVWVNDAHVGRHEGDYLPFEFDITDALRAGENTVTVRIDDPAALFAEIPHGKQGWYGPLSGIWQSVWVERRAPLHTRAMHLLPDLQTGSVAARLAFSTPAGERHRARVVIADGDGQQVAAEELSISPGAESAEVTLTVANPWPWSPDAPNLYTAEVTLLHDEEVRDSFSDQFGFRTIEARDGRLYLNGEVLFLRGALDQDYYPDTICTPPSVEFLEDQLLKAKQLGLNCLRCHIKVADPRYYEVADRLGMLVWTELPNWSVTTQDSARRGKETLEGIVARDWNHPSIIIWTIINEGWGMNLMNDHAHRAWLKGMYQWMKALDPTRLVVDNSPTLGSFHVQSDLEDYHFYENIPDHRVGWDTFVNRFAGRFAYTYSPYGDAERTGQEPLLVSEFGNWGLPDVDLLLDEQGREPWWFETGMEWGNGIMYPHAIHLRFYRYHLDKVFGSWRAFIEATQWQQFYALKYEIERMRRHPQIVGYVITELTDAHWECNGLLDMRRNPRVFHDQFASINADTVLIPEWQRTAYWSGDPVRLGLAAAHAAGTPIEGASVQWSLEDDSASGDSAVPELSAGTAAELDPISFYAPQVAEPTLRKLNVEMRSTEGDRLASSHLWLSIYPKREVSINSEAAIWTPYSALQHALAALGYPVTSNPQEAKVIVTREMTHMGANFIREGGRLLLLADGAEALGDKNFLGIELAARNGTILQGDWASSFGWVRREGPFARLAGGPLLDHSFDAIIPNYVLLGFGLYDLEAHVPAGLFVGWIHKVAALIGRRRYGKGKMVATTFRLAGANLGVDPTATTLLDALIEYTLTD